MALKLRDKQTNFLFSLRLFLFNEVLVLYDLLDVFYNLMHLNTKKMLKLPFFQ